MVNSDVLKRLEEKLDIIIDFNLKTDNEKITEEEKTEDMKKVRENTNRKRINKILYSLPELEEYAQLKDLSKEEIEDITDTYFQTIVMGTKDMNSAIEYSLFKDDMKDKLKTKLFVDRIHKILDSYLEKENDKKLDSSKRTENNSLEALNIKKTILRRVYGYKIQPGEKKVKSREQLSEELNYTPRTIYIYQNELLDDLAPSFFRSKWTNIIISYSKS